MYLNYLVIPHKHLGRDFSGCDCFGLVQLFYKEDLGITLPDYKDYDLNWFVKDALHITKRYKKFGFYKVDTPEYGDILLLNEAGYPKHLGVVVTHGCFLHTLETGTYCHSYLQGNYSSNKIHSIYRYNKDVSTCA